MFPSCSCLAYFPRFAIYKAYRRSTPDRQQVITRTADEFIRHFLLRRDHDQHRDHQLPLSAARSAMPNRPIAKIGRTGFPRLLCHSEIGRAVLRSVCLSKPLTDARSGPNSKSS